VADWTSDKEALRRALKWDFRPGTKSPLYDSLIYASEQVLPKVSGRRSVVLLTDGVDSPHAVGFEETLAALHRARAMVYVATQASILKHDIKPRAFNALSWYEMIDPQARKRIEKLRAYYRQLAAGEAELKGVAEETG